MRDVKEIYIDICIFSNTRIEQRLTSVDRLVRIVVMLNGLNVYNYPAYLNVVRRVMNILTWNMYSINSDNLTILDTLGFMNGFRIDDGPTDLPLEQLVLSVYGEHKDVPAISTDDLKNVKTILKSNSDMGWSNEVFDACDAGDVEKVTMLMKVEYDLYTIAVKQQLIRSFLDALAVNPQVTGVAFNVIQVLKSIKDNNGQAVSTLLHKKETLLSHNPMTTELLESKVVILLKLNEVLKELVRAFQLPAPLVNITMSSDEHLLALIECLHGNKVIATDKVVDAVRNGNLSKALDLATELLDSHVYRFTWDGFRWTDRLKDGECV